MAYKQSFPALTPDIRLTIRTIIANLMGDENRLKAMGRMKLTPDILSSYKDMQFEENVLRAIFVSQTAFDEGDTNAVPTKENIYNFLLGGLQDLSDDERDKAATKLATEIDLLWTCRTDPPQVLFLDKKFAAWLEKQTMLSGIDKMRDQVVSHADPRQAIGVVHEIFQRSMPRVTPIVARSGKQVSDAFWERMEKLTTSEVPGPVFPWPAMQKYIPVLESGYLCTWVGKSGMGKTTVAVRLAEHYAHQLENIDVLYISTETKDTSIYARLLTRELHFPSDVWRTGRLHNGERFYRNDPRWAAAINYFDMDYEKRDQERGKIEYIFAPGIDVTDVRTLVEVAATESMARGRQRVVIFDYLDRFGYTTSNGPMPWGHERNNAISPIIKDICGDNDVVGIMLAQDDMNNTYDSGRETPFGGQGIYHKSQYFIRIERERATENEALGNMANILGEPMYWHHADQYSSDTVFNILKANEDATGKVDCIKTCNAYFMIEEIVK